MLKTQIQYYGDRLCIHISGIADYHDIEELKERIKLLIREYEIRKIQLEIDNNCNVNIGDFDEFKSNFNYYYNEDINFDKNYLRETRA